MSENNEEPFIIECPHCSQSIEIIKLNCRIFRCGILKKDYVQIDPHLSFDKCEQLKRNDDIYGCGKPFRIDESGNVVICDYI